MRMPLEVIMGGECTRSLRGATLTSSRESGTQGRGSLGMATSIEQLTEAELVHLQREIDNRLVQLRAGRLGAPGVRDPDAPCSGFDPGKPGTAPIADCDSDGHYLCSECKRLVVCSECGQHCQAVAPATAAPNCTEGA